MAEYASIFAENAIDVSMLPDLDSDDLKELGVAKLGHRKTMLKDIAELTMAAKVDEYEPPVLNVDYFPSLLAVPLYEYMNEKNPVMKLWHACDAVELLLRLIVMLGISELKEKGLLSDKILRELKPRIEEPTLGKWKGMVIAVTDALQPEVSIFPELNPLVCEKLIPFLDGEGGNKTLANSFSALRNQLAHGGGMTKVAAVQLLDNWNSKIEQLFNGLEWLRSVSFIAKSNGCMISLSGSNTSNHGTFQIDDGDVEVNLEGLLKGRDTVVALRGDMLLSLWPFSLFGLPRSLNAEEGKVKTAVSQIYVRRGDVRLQYTPIGSDEICQSESEEGALEAFEQFFFIQDKHRELNQYEVRSFEQEIERDASRLIGRHKEISLVQGALREAERPILWLSGPPGMGKSYLMARVASELMLNPSESSLILAYRFKAGDDRCNRSRFIHFALERILGEDRSGFLKENRQLQPIAQLKKILEECDAKTRIIFILDGMDEIAESDPEFAREVVAALALPFSIWLCAGRSEYGLPEIFNEANARVLFDNGLPAMDYTDVHSMLLEKIGPLRKKLILQDEEDDSGQVVNPFVRQVLNNAKGFPIYVTYVIGDILANRYRHLDGNEKLPPSLGKYHEELLRRCSVGVLHQVVSPMAATVAIAREPLTVDALGVILHHNNSIPDEEVPRKLVDRGISAIASMLRRSSTPESQDGYTLFHHSLRQHMLSSKETRGILSTAEKNLAAMVSQIADTGSAKAYLLRWGVSHLLKVKQPSWMGALKRLFLNDQLIREKLFHQPLEDFFFDYVQAFSTEGFEASERFLQVIGELALEKLSANEWDLEQVHSLLVHRKNQVFYKSFLDYVTKQSFPDSQKYQVVVFGFKARLANLLRREGVENLAHAELLLQECLEELEVIDSNASMLERARLQYDLAYIIGFLRGRVEESLTWFDKSIQSSRDGGNDVGAYISTIARVQTEFYYERTSADEFYEIIKASKPVFELAAKQGDENGKRWIMNVHAHLFYASFTKGKVDSARKYFELLQGDPWYVRFGCEDELFPYKARLAMLNNRNVVAVSHFEDYFSADSRLEQVVISSVYLDYGTALKDAGRVEDALLIWDLGLQAHDDFGNRPWKQKIRARKDL